MKCDVTLSADTYSCYNSYTTLSSNATSSVSCTTTSKTVTAYGKYICDWDSDGARKSSSDISSDCTYTFSDNKHTTNPVSRRSSCEGLSYSFTHNADSIKDCTADCTCSADTWDQQDTIYKNKICPGTSISGLFTVSNNKRGSCTKTCSKTWASDGSYQSTKTGTTKYCSDYCSEQVSYQCSASTGSHTVCGVDVYIKPNGVATSKHAVIYGYVSGTGTGSRISAGCSGIIQEDCCGETVGGTSPDCTGTVYFTVGGQSASCSIGGYADVNRQTSTGSSDWLSWSITSASIPNATDYIISGNSSGSVYAGSSGGDTGGGSDSGDSGSGTGGGDSPSTCSECVTFSVTCNPNSNNEIICNGTATNSCSKSFSTKAGTISANGTLTITNKLSSEIGC